MGFLVNVFYAGMTAFLPFFGQLLARMYYRRMWIYLIFWIPIFWLPPLSFIPALYVLFGRFRTRKPMSTTTKILMAFFALIIVVVVSLIIYFIWKNFFSSNTQTIIADQLRNAANYTDPNYSYDAVGDGYEMEGGFDSTSPFI